MTEELKTEIEEKKENNEKKGKCCCCKELKMFLLVIFGSFLGCLVALCLFSAAIKPKFPPPMPMMGPPQIQQMHHGKFDRHQWKKQEFKKDKRDFKKAPENDFDGMRNRPPFDENDD